MDKLGCFDNVFKGIGPSFERGRVKLLCQFRIFLDKSRRGEEDVAVKIKAVVFGMKDFISDFSVGHDYRLIGDIGCHSIRFAIDKVLQIKAVRKDLHIFLTKTF